MSRHIRTIGKQRLVLLLAGSILVCCMIGCDRVARYKILTFFFEGVPSPDGKTGVGTDPNIISVTNVDTFRANKSEKVVTPDKWGQQLSSSHDFVKDCTQCHLGDLRSGQQELRRPLPDLCYSCHTDLHREGDFLHGPLNVGECLFCHDPHQSRYIHLQKAPQPELCYRCHQQADMVMIPGHSEHMQTICTDCHDPHGSSDPHLLKTRREQQDDPNRVD